jgi:hypothetical protein
MLDSTEECDESASGSSWSDACSNCKLTKNVYKACGAVAAGGECGGSSTTWFCSPVGACARVCGTDSDCPAPGKCLQTGSDRVCGIPCTPTQNPPQRGSCNDHEMCQYYGAEGQAGYVNMCGWVSIDPGAGKPWCPRELERPFQPPPQPPGLPPSGPGGCCNPDRPNDPSGCIHNACWGTNGSDEDMTKYPQGC